MQGQWNIPLWAIVVWAALVITGCSGERGGFKSPDVTPNSFSFIAKMKQPLPTQITFTVVTISGIYSVTGCKLENNYVER